MVSSLIVVRKGKVELADYAPANGRVGDQAKVNQDFFWNEEPRVVMAFGASTGRTLWAKQTGIAPLTLSADDDSAEKAMRLYVDGELAAGYVYAWSVLFCFSSIMR